MTALLHVRPTKNDLVQAMHATAIYRRSMECMFPPAALARAMAFQAGHVMRSGPNRCEVMVSALSMAIWGALLSDEVGNLQPDANDVEGTFWRTIITSVRFHGTGHDGRPVAFLLRDAGHELEIVEARS